MDGRKQGIQEYRNTVSKNRNRKGEIFHHTQRIQKKLSHVMFAEMKSNDIESIDGTYKLKKKTQNIFANVPVPVIVIYFARRAWQRLRPHTTF